MSRGIYYNRTLDEMVSGCMSKLAVCYADLASMVSYGQVDSGDADLILETMRRWHHENIENVVCWKFGGRNSIIFRRFDKIS